MAKIPMRSGFTLIPEGTYVFRIEKVEYDERFGKLEITLKTQSGMTHTERFSLLDNNGDLNEKALNAFSYFAKVALDNFDLAEGDEIDPQDLVGRFIEAQVEHQVLPKRDRATGLILEGQTTTFARLGEKSPSKGWSEAPKPVASETPSPARTRSWL